MTDSVSRELHVFPIGGISHGGRFTLARSTTSVTLIGGVSLDLTDATLPEAPATVTKVSLIGGVSVTVGPDVRVELSGFSLLGGRSLEGPPPADDAPHTVRIRHYGIIGGARVTRLDA